MTIAETPDPTDTDIDPLPTATAAAEWWRSAVIYQVYPRSFADSTGDGVGDLAGITARLPALRELGVDAVWLSPFYVSPQHDAGYDVADYLDVDPLFGTLDDFDRLVADAHALSLKVIVDIVPNHTSSEHPWFTAALAAGPGSVERGHYMFRDGQGEHGELPPNNWDSVFGGRAWTRVTEADGKPGQWYLHLFDESQPDLYWQDEWVREQFDHILRSWLDRGVDGFRIDVAHGLIKADGLPDWDPPALQNTASSGGSGPVTEPPTQGSEAPYWAQEGVHEIYHRWHDLAAEYPGDRVLCAEAWVEPLTKLAHWVRSDELQQSFNFVFLETPWKATALQTTIQASLDAFGAVGAPSTWVLSNHDVIRHASRLGLPADYPAGRGLGPGSPAPDAVLGLRRARAASALMLALPGSAYLYQGEELGLPEVIDIPHAVRQDPAFVRTDGQRYGRDGCRVPIPWEADAPGYGFNTTGESWLPQPAIWRELSRDRQAGRAGSTLELYRRALAVRAEYVLGLGAIEWLDGYGDDVVAFRNGRVTVIANLGATAVELPVGQELLASEELHEAALAPDTTVWLLAAP